MEAQMAWETDGRTNEKREKRQTDGQAAGRRKNLVNRHIEEQMEGQTYRWKGILKEASKKTESVTKQKRYRQTH